MGGPALTSAYADRVRTLRVVVIAVSAACIVLVVWLAMGALGRDRSAYVDDLPTVAEVIAAQAHAHGVSIPDAPDAPASAAPANGGSPSAASSLTGFEQMRRQLVAVAEADGAEVALAILHDAAASSPQVAADCGQLYDAIVAQGRSSRSRAEVCASP